MPDVCLYFQVHQPYRLRRYSVFDSDSVYFDDHANAEVCRKVAAKCYCPANALLLDLVRRHGGAFRVAFSVTGVALEQFERYAPEALDGFRRLADTGRVEFLAETYHHSLASVYSPAEFDAQVALHAARVAELFGQRPRVFRNTELVYDDALGRRLGAMGYAACLTEGADHVLGPNRSPHATYHPPGEPDGVRLLLRDYRRSDDVAFRFSDRSWSQWPLTAEAFAASIHRADGGRAGACVNLFMDYETVGEHQWAETGIFQFLEHLPAAVLGGGGGFVTPSELANHQPPVGPLEVPQTISWADTERNLSAWVGNAMQSNAVRELYALERPLLARGDPQLIEDWRRLQTSDHFYYMSTKYFADGQVHKYFSPYESPYDSYINYMNVLDDLAARVRQG